MHYIPVAPPPTTAIFRNFKNTTAPCKVHNMGLRYIKAVPRIYVVSLFLALMTNTHTSVYSCVFYSSRNKIIIKK